MRYFLTFILLFYLFFSCVYAYEFQNPDNKGFVLDEKREIYDLKSMYEELVGKEDDEEEIEYEEIVTSDSYWWPIGSIETTTVGGKLFAAGDPEETTITSTFGYRGAVVNSAGVQIAGNENHGALDIANFRGVGVTNVIAAKSGVVVYPTDKARIDCKSADKGCTGYGNYVIIQHSDGNYTLYAHLDANSITVRSGDAVDQGQVIAKMGTSGNSTGPHLHFEMRVGENTSNARVDPLEYVDKDNPRPVSKQVGGSAIDIATEVIEHFEGIGCMGQQSIDGDNYIACNGGDGVLTIGPGVTYENNIKYFEKYGYPSVSAGTRIPIDVVQSIKKEIIQVEHADAIYSALADAGIDNLKDYQVAALISRSYQCGGAYIWRHDYPNFIDAYLRYDGRYSLDDMYSSKPSIWMDAMNEWVSPNWPGAYRRRVSEWILFNTGEINYLEDGFDYSKYAWQ